MWKESYGRHGIDIWKDAQQKNSNKKNSFTLKPVSKFSQFQEKFQIFCLKGNVCFRLLFLFGFYVIRTFVFSQWKNVSVKNIVKLVINPAKIYLLKVTNKNIKLTIKTPERRQWLYSGVLLLTLNIFQTFF